MNKLLLSILLIFIVIFSGCSSSSGGSGFSLFGSSSKTPEVDRTGDGLTVNFETSDKFISVRQLDYTLTLENTGLEPVVLKKENFKLLTDVKMQDGSSVIEQTSLDNFYNTIFRGSDSITIYHDQKISGIVGSIFLKEEFFTKRTQEKFEYVLDIKYDYKTSFSNNLEIDFKSSNLIRILDSVSQAAPVKVTKIELSPISVNEYILKYYLSDKGQTSANEKSIKLKNMKIQFRTQELSGCKGIVKKDNVYKEVGLESLIINKDTPEVIVACKVDVSDIERNSKMITTTSGSFEYTYLINVKKLVSLPPKLGEQIVWQ